MEAAGYDLVAPDAQAVFLLPLPNPRPGQSLPERTLSPSRISSSQKKGPVRGLREDRRG